ncbi:hypothetical protein BCR34DRAFT_378847 [Clohesyomyces aquaticus]|uniref:Uncharacterized protein n=1 Tax=Clohesyomyces aquaticus TaxID=1231657 RepID=A0A1Y2A672_9PLEO|nr:hypothetical protein BCR34DRAFT_378847 [Clohesyomyces aquaticus]
MSSLFFNVILSKLCRTGFNALAFLLIRSHTCYLDPSRANCCVCPSFLVIECRPVGRCVTPSELSEHPYCTLQAQPAGNIVPAASVPEYAVQDVYNLQHLQSRRSRPRSSSESE